MDTPHASRWTRPTSFAIVTAAYVAAIVAFVAAASAVGTETNARVGWAVTVGYLASTAVLYAVSQVVQNGSTFDAWWSVLPPTAALWLVATADIGGGWARLVVTVLVLLWGVRLTANWALGWTGLDHEDWRYLRLYDTTPLPRWATSLLAVHLFPTLTVALASQPMAAALSRGRDWGVGSTVLLLIGALVTAGAIAIEHLADVELRRFNRRKQPGDILDTGWWSRSRHPNYLGEAGFWWGTGLMALAVDTGAWWTLIGPITITVMFLTASIPLIETRSAERRPGWADYAARTPVLIPRLGRSNM